MYGVWILAAIVLGLLVMAWQMKRAAKKVWMALPITALAAALGLAGSKVLYVILFADSTLLLDGLESLFYMDRGTFSLFGAMAGAMTGAWLAARMLRLKPVAMLDLFVPCCALALAVLRIGEQELGTVGVGGFVDPASPLARFPFAVTNAYGEHLYAVFYLEALFALLCGVFLLIAGRKWPEGMVMELGWTLLALPQIYCESLRARCMKWGFVRVEQLLCGLLVLALIAYACYKLGSEKKRRYWPVLWGALCIVGMALVEFALDKSTLPNWLCYGVMWGCLVGLAVLQITTVRKRFAVKN